MFKKRLIIPIMFLISAFCLNISVGHALPASQTKAVDFNQLFYAPTHFSTFVDTTTNQINIFTSYIGGAGTNGLAYTDYVGINGSYSAKSQGSIPLDYSYNVYTSSINGNPAHKVDDYTYYRSSNKDFLLLSTTYNGVSNLTIFLNQNNVYTTPTSSDPFYITSVTQLPNSNDVYFCAYNSTNFFIIKYSFTNNNFSIFFNSAKLQRATEKIVQVYVLTLNNEIYASIAFQDYSNYYYQYTQMYIISPNQIILNKTFNQIKFNTFTFLKNGILFYSMENSTFFDYSYASDSYTAISYANINNNYNFTAFKPFDNNSFLSLNFNQISLINIGYTNSGPVLQEPISYGITSNIYNTNVPYNQTSIDAFDLSGNQEYLINGLNNDLQYEMIIQNINSTPTDFLNTNTTGNGYISGNSFTASMTTSSFVTTSSGDPIIILVSLVFLIALIGFAVYIIQKNYLNKGYKQKDRSSFTKETKVHTSETLAKPLKRTLNFCFKCGTSTNPGDVFCQNCGEKLQ